MGLAETTIRRWRVDPVAFVRDNFKIEPDDWQVEALMQTVQPGPQKVSLQACAGPGKSAVLAWIGWHFLATQGNPPANDFPKGFAVAVSGDNLSANLWPEFHKWRLSSAYLLDQFEASSERLWQKDHKDNWFLAARTWPRTASPDEQGRTLSGLHGGYVLALIDESGSIPPAVAKAAEQALSTGPKYGVIVQAGNPLSREGMLFAATRSPSWKVIRITGDPDDPKRSKRIDIDWARTAIAEAPLGRDDPWVQAYILGQFPANAINSLLTVDEVEASMARHPRDADLVGLPQVWGIDVALEGLDRSVLVRRKGVCMWMPHVWRGIDGIQGAAELARLHAEHKPAAMFVDNSGGFGSSWIDQLKQLGHRPIPVVFGSGATEPHKFGNKRSEMWWRMAEWVRTGGALPDCPELVHELTVPTYTHKGDRLYIEEKKDIKRRLGRSPDIADALAMTFAAHVAVPDPPKEWLPALGGHRQDRRNPFDVRSRR